jgi:RNA polymerase sigma factor (sigma-70 family)
MTKEQVYSLIEMHYQAKAKMSVNRISRYLNNRSTAEDVVQEAYARCCQYWKSFNPEETFTTWFNTILNNTIKDSFRESMAQGMALDTPPPIDIPRSQILDHIELKELLAKIDKQPPKAARILRLFLLDGFYSHEITKIVSENAATIRKIVQRFRESLK